jgi:hypothetical protein
VTETSKVVDVLLPLRRKQHSYAQGHMLCLHYTLYLMQLSVVRNLILMGCSDDISMSGLLVIDAVGWRSMYFVVMPRVNHIFIFLTYHVIFILSPVYFTRTVYFTRIILLFFTRYAHTLFQANR